MDLDRVAPELRGSMYKANALGLEHRLMRRLLSVGFALLPSAKVDGVVLEKRSAAGQGLRVHRPLVVRSSAAFLWIHGGGYVLGRAVLNDRLCGEIARELGITAVAVEYRKAPEHPFPAALDDCHAAWTWLQREATSLAIDPARVAIGGESAGGGLAAALAQRLHDEGGIQPVGQLLFCPMLDDRTAARRELDAVDHFVWNNRKNRFGWRSYLGAEPGALTVSPYAVPGRRDDLAGLPPAWIGVSEIELFHSEDITYAERLRAAGVPAELDVVPDAPHGFESWAPDTAIARQHQARASAWLRGVLERARPSGLRLP
jgi:acetyl esterase/lipase